MTKYKDTYFKKINEYETQLLTDLESLMKINSVRDINTKCSYAPFGKGIRRTFDQMIYFSKRDTFFYEDFDGYAMHIVMGKGKEEIGILGHLDIVHEGEQNEWMFPPFSLSKDENYLYGRGVNDDKGPVIAAYYALRIIRDLNFPLKRKVKLILGGAEETTWECMEHYFKINNQPTMAFSPDGDFPIVNGEKGIVKGNFVSNASHNVNEKDSDYSHKLLYIDSVKQWNFVCKNIKVQFYSKCPQNLKRNLTEAKKVLIKNNFVTAFYEGTNILSRNPHKGNNILFNFIEDLSKIEQDIDLFATNFFKIVNDYFCNDVYGSKIGLYTVDKEMGHTTLCLTYVLFNSKEFEIGFDYRYPKGITKHKVLETMEIFSKDNNIVLEIKDSKELLYVNPESKLIQGLSKGYKNITGETAYCLTKGGASYARVLDKGVAFGPSFRQDLPNSHKPNEKLRISTLKYAIAIYCESIRILAT
ncbi:MAG TPA: Sapep family Mn(2+)-dependent dipeptidase [Pseudogracilibacillus sp.]|nr:Sapep family Mn(2+)-dependent dipeptidase [Pseudogracilibacillus sp.]